MAVIESFGSDSAHATRNADGGERGTVTECILADVCQRIGKGDGGQRSAAVERKIFDGCNGIGESDGRKRGTILKPGNSDRIDGTVDNDLFDIFSERIPRCRIVLVLVDLAGAVYHKRSGAGIEDIKSTFSAFARITGRICFR